MNQSKYLSVSEFNTLINNIIKAEEMLKDISILGEVSQFSEYGEHAYFVIKDAGGELNCTCFNRGKTYTPAIGESVLVTGSPNYYVKKGKLTFNVKVIAPVGRGMLYVKLEELKKKLYDEGLFAEDNKKPIPGFPKDICVVTSINGAVIRDIVTTVRLKNDIINIKVYDVRVQGEGAAISIVRALKDVDKLNFDLIILARGGGSLEDLMPFNDEQVARTIFALKTPIISAVGHETDFTIADFTADARAATPTAAAEMIAYNVEEWRDCIISKAMNMYITVLNKFNNYKATIVNSINTLSYQSTIIYERNLTRVNSLIKDCSDNIDKLVKEKSHALDKLITALDSNSPVRLLKSGYFRVKSNSMPVMSVKQVKIDDQIEVIGGDGRIYAKVIKIEGE